VEGRTLTSSLEGRTLTSAGGFGQGQDCVVRQRHRRLGLGGAAAGTGRDGVGDCVWRRRWKRLRGGAGRRRRLLGAKEAAAAAWGDIGSGKVARSRQRPARGKAVVEACSKAYDSVAGMAFAEATDGLGARWRRRR
jgi:hypothetical protein